MSRYRRLLKGAACADADPNLFDATDLRYAREALEYCNRCTVLKLCKQELNPQQTGYVGVCAGAVWTGVQHRMKEVKP